MKVCIAGGGRVGRYLAQSLTPDQFDELMQFIRKEVEFFGKKLN